jgi:hypothetical protein
MRNGAASRAEQVSPVSSMNCMRSLPLQSGSLQSAPLQSGNVGLSLASLQIILGLVLVLVLISGGGPPI